MIYRNSKCISIQRHNARIQKYDKNRLSGKCIHIAVLFSVGMYTVETVSAQCFSSQFCVIAEDNKVYQRVHAQLFL